MIFDDSNLAENKLFVLYVLDKIKLPLTTSQITQIILENSNINYFVLQQYIDELSQGKLITKNLSQDKSYYNITNSGKKILKLFVNRLSEDLCKDIDHYLENNRNEILNESYNIAKFHKKGDGEFDVELKILENESVIIDLALSVATHQQAKDIVDNWKSHGGEIYSNIIKSLIDTY